MDSRPTEANANTDPESAGAPPDGEGGGEGVSGVSGASGVSERASERRSPVTTLPAAASAMKAEDSADDVVRGRPPAALARIILSLLVLAAATLDILYNQGRLQTGGNPPIEAVVPAWVLRPLPQLLFFLMPPLLGIMAVASALLAMRWTLARDLALVWILGYALAFLVAAVTWHPKSNAAVLMGFAVVAGPYFGRVGKRLIWVYTLVTLAMFFAGIETEFAKVLGEVAIGVLAASSVQAVLGTVRHVLTPATVRKALADIGITVPVVERADVEARLSQPFYATTDDGRELFVKTQSQVDRDADLLNKVRRRLTLRGTGDDPIFTSSKVQIAHEAAMSALVTRAGVRTPAVVSATATHSGEAMLVEERISGRRLTSMAPGEIDDALLDRIWEQVAKLHANRLAHRDLTADNIHVDGDGRPWVIDLNIAEFGATDRKLAQDVAELLTSLAMAVGTDRAVGTAARTLPEAQLQAALPVLQAQSLAWSTRKALAAHEGLLDELRQRLADAVGGDVNERDRLNRVEIRTLVQVVGLGVAMYLVLPQLASFNSTIQAWQNASPYRLVLAGGCAFLTYVFTDVQMMGSVRANLPVVSSFLTQIASEFMNRVTPAGVGGMAVGAAYLRKHGYTATEAGLSVSLRLASAFLVQIAAIVVFVLLLSAYGGGTIKTPHVSTWTLVVIAGVVIAAAAGSLLVKRVRRRLVKQGRDAARALRIVFRQPRGALMLFGGSTLLLAAYTTAFLLSVYAFGAQSLPLLTGITIYVVGSAIGQLVPTPGGIGGIEAVLIAGLTATGKVDSGTAVAGVLTFRLFTYWLPIIPGIFAYRYLQRKSEI